MLRLRRIVRWSILIGLGSVVGVLGTSFVWRLFFAPPVDARIGTASGKVIQLRVLNATDVPYLARQLQQYLRRRGFDVVDADNAFYREQYSVVIDHCGDSNAVAQVLYALGLPPQAKRIELDSDLALHCSVVIGNDWRRIRAFR